jgi:hypothetical protein
MGLEGIVSKRLGSQYRSGRSKDWLKFKNPDAPAVRREAEENWGKRNVAMTDKDTVALPQNIWSNIDERGVDPALNYLFEKRKQEQSSQ